MEMEISIDRQTAFSVVRKSSAFRSRSAEPGQHEIPIHVDEGILVAWILPKKTETHLFSRKHSLFGLEFKLCRIVGWSNLLGSKSDSRSREYFGSSIQEKTLEGVSWGSRSCELHDCIAPIIDGAAHSFFPSGILLVGFGSEFRNSLKHFGFTLFSECLDLVQVETRFPKRFFEKFVHGL